MDYEKAYKEALAKAKETINYYKEHNRGDEASIEDLEEVFPELKESEDEQIRKGLIKALGSIGKRNWGGIDVFESIAWLEKQGKQKVSVDDFKAKNWYVSEVDGKIHDMTYNPADNIEPKFEVGDWVIHIATGYAHQIKELRQNLSNNKFGYKLVDGGYIGSEEAVNYRLWSIQDAKDGDILCSYFDNPFIYNGNYEGDFIGAYCGISTSKFVVAKESCSWTYAYDSKPATNEQCETLFKAMHEAGYEWDAEKKELKLLISNGGDFESNNSKQKPTWSDEDETLLYEIVDYFNMDDALRHTENEIIDWLKSLKERLL